MADQKITLFFENFAGERGFSTNNGILRTIFQLAKLDVAEGAYDLLKSKDPVVSITVTAPEQNVEKIAQFASSYDSVAVAKGDVTKENLIQALSPADRVKLAIWTLK